MSTPVTGLPAPGTPGVHTREQVSAAFTHAFGLIAAVTEADLADNVLTGAQSILGDGRVFGTEAVTDALNSSASTLDDAVNGDEYEDSDVIWRRDVINLAVNVASWLLDHPGDTLTQAVTGQYASDAESVLSWVS